MDGFAVRAPRDGRSRAYLLLDAPVPGARKLRPLREGQALRVGTGATLPLGANAVVRVESARCRGSRIDVPGPVRPGLDVLPKGESIRRGETLLKEGERVGPYHLSALLAEGVRSVPVYDVRVGVLPVGDEIRGPGGNAPGSVVDLIGPVVRRLFPFASARLLRPVGDDAARLRRAISRELPRVEMFVTIGRASVGERDVVKSTLREMGELLFEGVRVNVLKRGAVAVVDRTPVLVLPGQVVSAVTNVHEHGLHLLGRMVGRELRHRVRARLSRAVLVNHRMDSTYLFRLHDGWAEPLPWGVARLSSLLHADAFGILGRGRDWKVGQEVELQLLELSADGARPSHG